MNARQKKVLSVLGIGSAVLAWRVYVVVTAYIPAAAQATPVSPVESAPVAATEAAPDPMTAIWEKQHALEERPWGHDPFAAPQGLTVERNMPKDGAGGDDSSPRPAPRIGFSGVSNVGDQFKAIVKTGIVAVGDPIDNGFTVKAIERDKITLSLGHWVYAYELGSERPTIQKSGVHP